MENAFYASAWNKKIMNFISAKVKNHNYLNSKKPPWERVPLYIRMKNINKNNGKNNDSNGDLINY